MNISPKTGKRNIPTYIITYSFKNVKGFLKKYAKKYCCSMKFLQALDDESKV